MLNLGTLERTLSPLRALLFLSMFRKTSPWAFWTEQLHCPVPRTSFVFKPPKTIGKYSKSRENFLFDHIHIEYIISTSYMPATILRQCPFKQLSAYIFHILPPPTDEFPLLKYLNSWISLWFLRTMCSTIWSVIKINTSQTNYIKQSTSFYSSKASSMLQFTSLPP